METVLFKIRLPDAPTEFRQLLAEVTLTASTESIYNLIAQTEEMIVLIFFFVLLWNEAQSWGFKNGVLHNSIWLGKNKMHSFFSFSFIHFAAERTTVI